MIRNFEKLTSPKKEQRFSEGSQVMFSECSKGTFLEPPMKDNLVTFSEW